MRGAGVMPERYHEGETALPVRVEVGEAGVTLRGGGCEETIAVVRAAK